MGKRKWAHSRGRCNIPGNLYGILIRCNHGEQDKARREVVDLLEEYIDEFKPVPEPETAKEEQSESDAVGPDHGDSAMTPGDAFHTEQPAALSTASSSSSSGFSIDQLLQAEVASAQAQDESTRFELTGRKRRRRDGGRERRKGSRLNPMKLESQAALFLRFNFPSVSKNAEKEAGRPVDKGVAEMDKAEEPPVADVQKVDEDGKTGDNGQAASAAAEDKTSNAPPTAADAGGPVRKVKKPWTPPLVDPVIVVNEFFARVVLPRTVALRFASAVVPVQRTASVDAKTIASCLGAMAPVLRAEGCSAANLLSYTLELRFRTFSRLKKRDVVAAVEAALPGGIMRLRGGAVTLIAHVYGSTAFLAVTTDWDRLRQYRIQPFAAAAAAAEEQDPGAAQAAPA